MSESLPPFKGLNAQWTEALGNEIAQDLFRLENATPNAIGRRFLEKGAKRDKKYFPSQAPCPECPKHGRETFRWVVKNGKEEVERIWEQPTKVCRDRMLARLVAEGVPRAEAARRATAVHYAKVTFQHYVDHLRGGVKNAKGTWEDYHLGTYTFIRGAGDCDYTTKNVWDFDKTYPGSTPLDLARRVCGVLVELGLGEYVFKNSSHGGTGIHLRLYHDNHGTEPGAPGWLSYAFGRAVLEKVGIKPGGNPSAGECESFPKGPKIKESEASGAVGLHSGTSKMVEGQTNPLDASWQKVYDLHVVRAMLQAQKKCPREAFAAACLQLGIDPTKKPEPKAPPAPRRPVKIQGANGVSILSGERPIDVLERLVLERTSTLTQDLAAVGRYLTGSKTWCPGHNEPIGEALSFSVHEAPLVAAAKGIKGPYERGRCFGNCAGTDRESIDKIDFWRMQWGCSRREATERLAREQLGMNVAVFFRERRQQQEAVVAKAQPEPPHPKLAAWVGNAGRFVDTEALREKFTLALGRVLLPLGLNLTTLGVSIAAGFGLPRGETFQALDESKRRLEGQQACPGLPWIRRRISPAGMRELSRIVVEILRPESPAELERKIVGPHRPPRGGPGRHLLRDWRLPIPRKLKALKPGSKPPWWGSKKEDDEEQDQEHVAHMTSTTTAPEHPDTRIRSMLHWPGACGDFNQTVRGDGQKVGQIGITCNMTSVCVGCAMNHFGGVYDLLTASQDPQENPAHELSWRGKATTFHAVWTSVPLSAANVFLKDAADLRRPAARLRLLGMDLERPGWAKIMFMTHDQDSSDDALEVIRSGLRTASDTCPELAALGDVGLWNWHGKATTTSVKLAASWVFDQGMSLSYYAAECLERADKAAMFAYLHWIKGKSFARATGKRQDGRPRLRVPPRAVVRAATQKHASDMAMYEGQQLTYELTWGPSGYVLGTRDQPWTIGGALAVAESSQSFQDHVVQFDQQQSLKARGAVPATA